MAAGSHRLNITNHHSRRWPGARVAARSTQSLRTTTPASRTNTCRRFFAAMVSLPQSDDGFIEDIWCLGRSDPVASSMLPPSARLLNRNASRRPAMANSPNPSVRHRYMPPRMPIAGTHRPTQFPPRSRLFLRLPRPPIIRPYRLASDSRLTPPAKSRPQVRARLPLQLP